MPGSASPRTTGALGSLSCASTNAANSRTRFLIQAGVESGAGLQRRPRSVPVHRCSWAAASQHAQLRPARRTTGRRPACDSGAFSTSDGSSAQLLCCRFANQLIGSGASGDAGPGCGAGTEIGRGLAVVRGVGLGLVAVGLALDVVGLGLGVITGPASSSPGPQPATTRDAATTTSNQAVRECRMSVSPRRRGSAPPSG